MDQVFEALAYFVANVVIFTIILGVGVVTWGFITWQIPGPETIQWGEVFRTVGALSLFGFLVLAMLLDG